MRELACPFVEAELVDEVPPVLSPELVLVSSPDDIRAALAELPEEPWRVAPVARPPLREEFADLDVHISPARRGKLRAAGLVALVLIGAGAVGYRVGTHSRDNDAAPRAALRPPAVSQSARPAPARTVSAAPSQRQQTPSRAPARTRARAAPVPARRTKSRATAPAARAASTRQRPNARATAKTPVRKKTAPPRAIAFVPARTWAWAPAKDAAAYEVTFFRGREIVFQARPAEPRIVLPRSFRFHAGTYRWTVHALPVAAGTAPLVDSTFSLTSAGAEQANRATR
jgi:hypothetical protein